MALHSTRIQIKRLLPPVPFINGERQFSAKGLLQSVKRWLWERWSDPAVATPFILEVVEIEREYITTLVANALNKENLHPRDVERVILGPDQYCKFRADMAPLCFDVEVGFNCEYAIFAVSVQMVPWFDGVLVVPHRSKKQQGSCGKSADRHYQQVAQYQNF